MRNPDNKPKKENGPWLRARQAINESPRTSDNAALRNYKDLMERITHRGRIKERKM